MQKLWACLLQKSRHIIPIRMHYLQYPTFQRSVLVETVRRSNIYAFQTFSALCNEYGCEQQKKYVDMETVNGKVRLTGSISEGCCSECDIFWRSSILIYLCHVFKSSLPFFSRREFLPFLLLTTPRFSRRCYAFKVEAWIFNR